MAKELPNFEYSPKQTTEVPDHFYNDKVQYVSKALNRHGGEGAFYFFLKKSENIFP